MAEEDVGCWDLIGDCLSLLITAAFMVVAIWWAHRIGVQVAEIHAHLIPAEAGDE